jgi:hypothetical protein
MTDEQNLLEPVELNEQELDAVAGGQPPEQAGLVNVQIRDTQILVAAQALAANSEQDVFAPFQPE